MFFKYFLCATTIVAFHMLSYSEVDARVVRVENAKAHDRINDAFIKCAPKNTDIPQTYKLIGIGKYLEEEYFRQTVFCVYKETGLAFDDGRLNAEAAGLVIPDEEFVEAQRNCTKYGTTAEETNWMSFKCFQDTTPVYLQL